MITTVDLKSQTRRELADLARNYNIAGWHSLRKDELVAEIKKVQRRNHRKSKAAAASKKPTKSSPSAQRGTAKTKSDSKTKTLRAGKSSAKKRSSASPQPTMLASASVPRVPPSSHKADQARLNKPVPKLPEPKVDAKTARIRAQIRRRRETMQKNKDLSTGMLVGGSAIAAGTQRTKTVEAHRDRVVLMVRDSYWLQATWEITRASVQRAQSSLAERWHTAVATLRILSVGDTDSNGAESVERDIPIHGGVNNWYIDVDDPPSRYRVLVGYLTSDGEFHALCRSNVVETPQPNECERLDEHWHDIAEDYERIYSLSGGYETDEGDLKELFEERLRRSMPSRNENGLTVSEPTMLRQAKLPFEVDAELIVYGKTLATSSVLVAGRPVKLQPDGSFTVRMALPDKRQVLPVTAESRDGLRQRTTVIAVERNTKVMETVDLDDRF